MCLARGILYFALGISAVAQTTPPPSPVANHLVGTLLGEPETRGLTDFRTEADLLEVTDFAFLPNGNMVVADALQNRLFVIGPDGILRPFAGTGAYASSGDGGLALEAGIRRPTHLAVDGAGNVLVTELRGFSRAIRRITPAGVIQTIAGGGAGPCPELGATAATAALGDVNSMTAGADGTVYFFTRACGPIFRIGSDGILRQAGVEAGSPVATPFPPGSPIGFPASTVAPLNVNSMTVDLAGNLHVVVSPPSAILRITPAGVASYVGRFDGGGLREGNMKDVGFRLDTRLAAMPGGGLAIAQTGNRMLPQVELGLVSASDNYTILFTEDQHRGRPAPRFQGLRIDPNLVRVSPSGEVFVRDAFSHSIFRVSSAGALTHFVGVFRRAEPTVVEGSAPVFRSTALTNLVTDADGNIYFGDRILQRLYRLGPDGVLSRVAGNTTTGPAGVGGPALEARLSLGSHLFIDNQKRLYLHDTDWHRILRVTIGGNIEAVLGGTVNQEPAEGQNATDLIATGSLNWWAVSPSSEIYFHRQSIGGHRIWRVDTEGKLRRFAGGGVSPSTTPLEGLSALDAELPSAPTLLEVDQAGTVFFQIGGDRAVMQVDAEGVIRTVARGDSPEPTDTGTPTLSAFTPVLVRMIPARAGVLLTQASGPNVLAEYVVGGNVQVLRRSDTGTPRRDGGLLGDETLVHLRNIAPLPGGALVWVERGNGFSTIRRSFPVPNGCTYTVNATELNVGGSNSLTNLSLTTGNDCPWTAGTSANWLKILTNRTGKGSTTVQLNTLANPSPSPRTGTVLIAGRQLVVTQAASTRTDIFLVSPSAATVPATGGTVTVSIVASPQQSWQVGLPGIPLGFDGAAAGSGSAQFTLTVPALPAGMVNRSFAVSVNAATVAITQTLPPVPVAFTLTSNLAGQKAFVDLVERTLPYQAQWVPGSTHVVQVAPVTELSAGTRIQFQGWPGGGTEPERILLAPAAASQVELAFRRLHRLGTNTNLGNLPNAPRLALGRFGEPIPATLPSPPAADGTQYAWFPEGETVQVLAPNGDGLRFANFSGAISSTQNPVSVPMDAPRQLLANYTQGNQLLQDLRLGGVARWRFPGTLRAANPAQVSVSFADASSQAPSVFVSYPQNGGRNGWLKTRPSGATPPYTMELAIDPTIADGELANTATVYFHRPDGATISTPVEFSQLTPESGSAPRITAITDAGGFRQSVTDVGYQQTSLVGAPGMILTLFGENLAAESGSASAVPLPLSLAGSSVERWRFAEQDWVPLALFFVSPGQINFQLPAEFTLLEDQTTELRLRVRRAATLSTNETRVMLRNRSVSLFSANSSGAGAPAGFAVRVRASGAQERSNLFQCAAGQCTVATAPLGGTGDELFLELFGTGFRNRGTASQMKAFVGSTEAEIVFAGPHPQFVGLDQANIKVPRTVPRGQDLDLYLWVRNGASPWIASNRLTVRFE
ncbi:MAG: hypothetical protein MUF01_11095 [Bryobacterales bacterium]|nr:hypothetical protein [Bryobacterales bacterium]